MEQTTIPAPHAPLSWVDKTAAVFLGLAVTTVAFGPALVGVFLGLAALIILPRFVQRRLWARIPADFGKSLGLAIIATFAWWLVCSLVSIDPGRAFSTWARTVGLVFLAYSITHFLACDRRLIDWFLKAVIVAGMPILLYLVAIGFVDVGFIALMEWVKGHSLDAGLFGKGFRSVISCILPVMVWAAFRLRGGWRILAVVMVVLSGLAIYAGDAQMSRSAVAGVAAGLAAVLLLVAFRPLPQVARRAIVVIGIVAVTVGGLVFLDKLPRPPMTGRELARVMPLPDAHRQVIWGFAEDQVKKRPVFGTGMNTINLTPEAQKRHHPFRWLENKSGETVKTVLDLEYLPSHPHNWVLEVAAENGVPGLVLMLAAILLLLGRFMQAAYSGARAGWFAFVVTAVFFVGSLANFSFWSVWWQASFLIFLAVAWAATRQEEGRAA